MAKFSLQPLSAWLQPDRSNAVGIAWVTRVSQPDAEAHKSDGASHCMGYFIQQHKNMCAHTGMDRGCFLRCIYSKNAPQVPNHRRVCVCAGGCGVYRNTQCVTWLFGMRRWSRRDQATGERRRRPDTGVPVFSFTAEKVSHTKALY